MANKAVELTAKTSIEIAGINTSEKLVLNFLKKMESKFNLVKIYIKDGALNYITIYRKSY